MAKKTTSKAAAAEPEHKTSKAATVERETAIAAAEREDIPGCLLKSLPDEERYEAAVLAIEENLVNEPPLDQLALIVPDFDERQALAVLTTKYWGPKGVKLGVHFLDTSDTALKNRILAHFNAWNDRGANVVFQEASLGMAQIRVSRQRGQGYWSYLGTDIMKVRSGATMNLDSFSLSTPEATFRRVARHEIAHSMGCPHEHLRRSLIQRLDVQKTLAYFRRTQGWNDATIRSNVLTPLEERSIIGTPEAEETSIMAYSIPGECTKDGRPILGGNDITNLDYEFVGSIYPGETEPPPPPPPAGAWTIKLSGNATVTGTGVKPTVL